jgi:type IV pilus assembly protein PilW
MSASASRQSGMSLIELMVAITIGLMLSIVAAQAYMSASSAQSSQTDLTRIQESARFTFDLVGREARLAGYRDNTWHSSTGTPGNWLNFDTSAAATSHISGTNDAATVTLGGGVTATVLNRSDTVTFRYYGHDIPAATGADGSILDCQGNAIRRNDLLEETLYVAADASNGNEPTLFCSTWVNATGTPTQVALIPGVESLQILYGEDTDQDGVINRYVPIGSVGSLGLVKAIWVSAVIRAAGNSTVAPQSQVFNHFGQTYAPGDAAPGGDAGSVFTGPSDSHVRRVLSSVMALRNNL